MSRRISRRAVIGGAAAIVAGGGVTAALVAVSKSGDSVTPANPDGSPTPVSPETSPTGSASSPTATVAPTEPPAAIRLIPADPNSIERVVLGPADLLPWINAVYFKQANGSVEGFHLGPEDEGGGPQHGSAGRGEFVVVRRFQAGERLGILRDRAGTFALAWDTEKLDLSAAGPGHFIFRELTGHVRGDDLIVTGLDGEVRHRVVLPSPTGEAHFSPDGRYAVTASTQLEVPTWFVVDLASGAAREVARGPSDYSETYDGQGFLLTSGRGTGERWVRWHEWSGTVTHEERVDVDETTSNLGEFYLFEGGVPLAIRAISMHPVTSVGIGGIREWPAVEIVDLARGEAVYRIRSTALSAFDYGPPRRWLSASTGFTCHYLVNPDIGSIRGSGWGVFRTPNDLRAVPPSEPGQLTQRGRVTPSPWEPALLAGPTGTFDLRTETWSRIVAPYGTAHVDPFSARRNETVFVTPHGGHGGAGPFPLLPPVLERQPFDDRMLFKVARTGDCLNLRARPSQDAESLTCLPDGTEVELDKDPSTTSAEEDASTRHGEDGEGIWAFVRAGEQRGWVSIQYLDWATGEPLLQS